MNRSRHIKVHTFEMLVGQTSLSLLRSRITLIQFLLLYYRKLVRIFESIFEIKHNLHNDKLYASIIKIMREIIVFFLFRRKICISYHILKLIYFRIIFCVKFTFLKYCYIIKARGLFDLQVGRGHTSWF